MNATKAEPTHVYIGRVPGCGCIEAFYVDDLSDPKRVGKNVGDFIKSGYEVSRVPISDDLRMRRCTHKAEAPLAAGRGGLLEAIDGGAR